MVTSPTIVERQEQAYAGIRVRVTWQEIGRVVPPLWPEVFGWLGRKGVAPAGPPFILYLQVDMEGEMELVAGVPVAVPVTGDDRVEAGSVPAGRYATLVHTGPPEEAVAANVEIQRWGEENGVRWQVDGKRWGGRIEYSLTNPAEEPDRAKWQTEVAYMVAGPAPM